MMLRFLFCLSLLLFFTSCKKQSFDVFLIVEKRKEIPPNVRATRVMSYEQKNAACKRTKDSEKAKSFINKPITQENFKKWWAILANRGALSCNIYTDYCDFREIRPCMDIYKDSNGTFYKVDTDIFNGDVNSVKLSEINIEIKGEKIKK